MNVARGLLTRMFLVAGLLGATVSGLAAEETPPAAVIAGLREFYARTARPDGSFQPGVDPDYRGMSDSAYSDLAAVTYAVTIHKTFGWKLPREEQTIAHLLGRQRESGEFINIAGTVDPASAEGKTYNTTQALVALRALGVKPKHDPLPVFEQILQADYRQLPPYSTSFFPLAYLCAGQPIPAKADRGIRALMVQDRTGYTNDHIAATYHASHYYHLVGEPTPKSAEMVERILADQSADGSWLLNMPSRDRHATFDAVFTLHHEGTGRDDCAAAIARAVRWVLSCRNPDGGFGHYPGSTSDADAIYFHVGTLVMAGYLKPVNPLPPDPHLLSWGHLMPTGNRDKSREVLAARADGWVGAVAFTPDQKTVLAGSAASAVHAWDLVTGKQRFQIATGGNVAALAVAPDGQTFAAGSYDHRVTLWDSATGDPLRTLAGHRGGVLTVAFSPDGSQLASGGIDGTILVWRVSDGARLATWTGHKSWVNALAYSADGERLISGSSDGTVRIWNVAQGKPEHVWDVTDAEVRSVAVSRDGRWLAAGLRYGGIKIWDWAAGREQVSFSGHESDVWDVAFTPDNRRLISGNGDWNRPGAIKCWSVGDWKEVDAFQHTGEVLCLAVSRDGRFLAAGAGDQTLRVWKLP
jgi:WD40 repeat protein